MKQLFLTTVMIFSFAALMAQGYQVGDKAQDFKLKNVDGKMVSMADFKDAKGFVVIFTCNHCPYAVAYEDRIIDLHKKYAPKGFPVIAINPNDSVVVPADSYSAMIVRAKEKQFPFPYLLDADQKVYPVYGATRTPHIYLLERKGNDLVVAYIGAIDDNYQDAEQVKETYLANAIEALLKGQKPSPDFTKAIGCTIKKQK